MLFIAARKLCSRRNVSNSSGSSLSASSYGNGFLNISRRELDVSLVVEWVIECCICLVHSRVSVFSALPIETVTGFRVYLVGIIAHVTQEYSSLITGGAAGNEGLGLFAISLDWNYVGSGGGSMGALFTPISTQLSLYCGTAICM